MSNVFRYSLTRVWQRESLAEHSFYVAFLADMIAEDIIHKHPNIKINREKILRFWLIHDFDETVTWDMTTPTKYRSPILRAELEKVGKEMLNETLDEDFVWNLHIKEKIISMVDEYEKNKFDVLENSIVKFADMLQCLSYSLIEYKSWNSFFEDIIKSAYDGLIEKFSDHDILGAYCNDIKKASFVSQLWLNLI